MSNYNIEYHEDAENNSNLNDVEMYRNEKISEFNRNFREYIKTRNEDLLENLNQSLSVLITTLNNDELNPDTSEVAHLFANLYRLMTFLDSKSELLWSAVDFLKESSRSSTTRLVMIQKFKFLQIITEILESTTNKDKVYRTLTLLADLTYGIVILWKEPYLLNLIKMMINIINEDQEKHAILALHTLINLCYKNVPSICILRKIVDPTVFLKRIEKYGVLGCKMNIILRSNLEYVSMEEINNLIKFTFQEVHRSLQTSNVGLLRHTADFFFDMKSHKHLLKQINNYDKYKEDMKKILPHLTGPTEAEITKHLTEDRSECISISFELINNILQSNATNIKQLLPGIAKSCLNWISSDVVGPNALHVIGTMASLDVYASNLDSMINELESSLIYLLIVLKTIPKNVEHIFAVLKLLGSLLPKKISYEAIRDELKIFLFDFILENILKPKKNSKSYYSNRIEISNYILAMKILDQLENIDPHDIWGNKLKILFDSKIVQLYLVKAILSDDPEICAEVLKLTKHMHFPIKIISEIIASQGEIMITTTHNHNGRILIRPEQECMAEDNIISSNFVNLSLEGRLNKLIDKMSGDLKANKIGDAVTSEVLELFQYKIAIHSNEERDLLSRLDKCNTEVTNLSHKLALLSAEVSTYQSQNLSMKMELQRSKEENSVLQKENNKLTESLNINFNELDIERSHQAKLISQMESKDVEIKGLNDLLINREAVILEQREELKNLQSFISFEREEKSNLEKNLQDIKILTNQFEKQISEKDKEIYFQQKEMEALKKERSLYQDKMCKFEIDLKEKDDVLEECLKNLKKFEQKRHQVLSIMEENMNFV